MTDSFAFPALPDNGLPPGRMVKATNTAAEEREVLWVSDERQPRADVLWGRLYDQRADTGLYPLLLDVLDPFPPAGNLQNRPWHSGELGFVPVEKIDALDAEQLLRGMWPMTDDAYASDLGAPSSWPGVAAPGTGGGDPGVAARKLAHDLARKRDRLIGLVPATRGADAIALSGWEGAVNLTNDTEELSAIVRSWEDRFDVRVVMLGFDTLYLSVAAPPTTQDHALQVAAEHLTFCPDNFDFGTFDDYAAKLIGCHNWGFWWD
ncbi:DUF4253 domain-containing protein [Nocardia iowensis]|uniref:DUF4253 domain-containing protein n=1 Tax=Nocardia iowensis TaxID=204891 RepID=A0ABX8RQN7_NOCIO|nr:DUF4253 domain-containing protein [Nocardia iowensis]QXN91934.1 DUF4253 domain-containing protein [Nocardia iowensis]